MTQGIQEQIGPLAAIESECHLFEVGLEMLRAQLVPATAQTALEQRERGFDAIGVGISADVFLRAVFYNLVFTCEPHATCNPAIDWQFIGEEHVYVRSNISSKEFFERSCGHLLGVKQSEFSVPLTDAEDRTLFGTTSALFCPMPFAADICFVHLNFAVEHGLFSFGHRSADSVAEIPSCLVAHSERALNLAGRHSLFRFAEQECGGKPLFQWEVRIIEHRASGHAELVVTVFAVEQSLFGFKLDGGSLAARALRAFGPAQAAQQFAALGVSREHGVYVN